jgi:hypothetical protein
MAPKNPRQIDPIGIFSLSVIGIESRSIIGEMNTWMQRSEVDEYSKVAVD